MDKEEAIKMLKGMDIKFFLNGSTEQSNYIVDTADKVNSAIETLLQAVENSIPTQVVEEKIKEYKKLIDECREDEEHYGEIPLYEHDIKVLQELLQEKKKEVGR